MAEVQHLLPADDWVPVVAAAVPAPAAIWRPQCCSELARQRCPRPDHCQPDPTASDASVCADAAAVAAARSAAAAADDDALDGSSKASAAAAVAVANDAAVKRIVDVVFVAAAAAAWRWPHRAVVDDATADCPVASG